MHTKYTPSLPEWTALLSISTRFEMADIRNRAIAEVDQVRSTIEAVEQVVLAVTHHVPAWLPDAYTALCLRDAPITLLEMKRIGDETMVLVAEAREAVLKAKLESRDLVRELPRSISPPRGCDAAEPALKARTSNDWGFLCGEVASGLAAPNSSEPTFAAKQEPVLPLFSVSVARRIVDEVFWREERERKRLEREVLERLEREERELERLKKEKRLEGVREAKEKAARQLSELEELQEALGDESRLHKKKSQRKNLKGLKGANQLGGATALAPGPTPDN
jgi:hypothetical protein